MLSDIPHGDSNIQFIAGPKKGENVHDLLMKSWRALRAENKLPYLEEKIIVMQQDNAWCTANLQQRLFEIWIHKCEQLNKGQATGYIVNADLFVGTFCEESKEKARELNAWLTPIGPGVTLPCQIVSASSTRRGLRVCFWCFIQRVNRKLKKP